MLDMPARSLPIIGRRISKLLHSGRMACWSARRRARRVRIAVFEILCLPVRKTARLLITLQDAASALLSVKRALWLVIIAWAVLSAFAFGWLLGSNSQQRPDPGREELTGTAAVSAVVDRIIRVESNGDPNARNKRSSATGLGQFLNETWLDMIRAHRPDLAKGRNENEILELRRDATLAREITTRFAERNAAMLRQRGFPVTPGTVYLAHFAGGAGAVAVLSALENSDAALVMASADATGQTKRERIVKANPFLERFTIADLKKWADRKMHGPPLHLTELALAGTRK
jgi:hypothetical protein